MSRVGRRLCPGEEESSALQSQSQMPSPHVQPLGLCLGEGRQLTAPVLATSGPTTSSGRGPAVSTSQLRKPRPGDTKDLLAPHSESPPRALT